MTRRGFWGVAFYNPKYSSNIGSLCRTAKILGASFICIIGKRLAHQATDTMKSYRHLPYFEYDTFDEFVKSRPNNASLIGIEMTNNATELKDFIHPERAIYIVGAEDSGLPESILTKCDFVVKLDGPNSMNVAVAGSIVFYHRTSL